MHSYLGDKRNPALPHLFPLLVLLPALLLSPAASAQHAHSIPLFVSAHSSSLRGFDREGFARIINRSGHSGSVRIQAIDDSGWRAPIVTLAVKPRAAVGFNANDLENGNPDKGLSGLTGPPRQGDWRLALDTNLHIRALAYVRSRDGFVTSMHDFAPVDLKGPGRYWAPFFNPASNFNQVSRLRLINPNETEAAVTIRGADSSGRAAARSIRLAIPAGAARTLTARELESGSPSFAGAFGDGAGKWELFVTADRFIQALSLLETPTGHLTNLSTAPQPAPPTYDSDDDGLIEVFFLEQLDAMRHDLDGDGKAEGSDPDAYAAAFPDAVAGAYRGYELARSLDFKDPDSYASGEVNPAWIRGDGPAPGTRGWAPLPSIQGTFDGNGHTIVNLFIHRVEACGVGLFAAISGPRHFGEIRNLGLTDVDLTGKCEVGGLAGQLLQPDVEPGRRIVACSASGKVAAEEGQAGGLVGVNQATVAASYADVRVTAGTDDVGGLVGKNEGIIAASYAVGDVAAGGKNVGGLVGQSSNPRDSGLGMLFSYASGAIEGDENVGGLVGANYYHAMENSYAVGEVAGRRAVGGFAGYRYGARITASYWNVNAAGTTGIGDGISTGVRGKTRAELTAPTDYRGIYLLWNRGGNIERLVDGVDGADMWDFGASDQYPALKVDFDGDGNATWEEFGDQPR